MKLGQTKYYKPGYPEQHQWDNDSCTNVTQLERVACLRIEAVNLVGIMYTYSYVT
jgi:hypothetical protein